MKRAGHRPVERRRRGGKVPPRLRAPGVWRDGAAGTSLSARRTRRIRPSPPPPHPRMIDLFHIDDFLDPATRASIVAELHAAAGAPATVLSADMAGRMDASRRTTRVAVSPETRALVKQRLMDRKAEIEAHFGVKVTECEDPQFLRYETGDYFVA